MHRVDEDRAHIVNETMRRFLSHLSRCRFAPFYLDGRSSAAPVSVVLDGPIEREDVSILDDALDFAAEARVLTMIVLPHLRTSVHVRDLIVALAQGARWDVTLPSIPQHPHDDTLVGLWWRTARGDLTSVMGLGPFGEMPVTRRAPHVALVAWTGEHENPHAPPRPRAGEVGLTSMPLTEQHRSADAYRRAWEATIESVKRTTSFPLEASARPHVAFSLSSDIREQLEPYARPCDKRGLPHGT